MIFQHVKFFGWRFMTLFLRERRISLNIYLWWTVIAIDYFTSWNKKRVWSVCVKRVGSGTHCIHQVLTFNARVPNSSSGGRFNASCCHDNIACWCNTWHVHWARDPSRRVGNGHVPHHMSRDCHGNTRVLNVQSLQQDELDALKERNRELELNTKVSVPFPTHLKKQRQIC